MPYRTTRWIWSSSLLPVFIFYPPGTISDRRQDEARLAASTKTRQQHHDAGRAEDTSTTDGENPFLLAAHSVISTQKKSLLAIGNHPDDFPPPADDAHLAETCPTRVSGRPVPQGPDLELCDTSQSIADSDAIERRIPGVCFRRGFARQRDVILAAATMGRLDVRASCPYLPVDVDYLDKVFGLLTGGEHAGGRKQKNMNDLELEGFLIDLATVSECVPIAWTHIWRPGGWGAGGGGVSASIRKGLRTGEVYWMVDEEVEDMHRYVNSYSTLYTRFIRFAACFSPCVLEPHMPWSWGVFCCLGCTAVCKGAVPIQNTVSPSLFRFFRVWRFLRFFRIFSVFRVFCNSGKRSLSKNRPCPVCVGLSESGGFSDFSGHFRIFPDFPGISRIFPDFPGFSWIFLDFPGVFRIFSDFPGSFRISPDFFRIFPDFPGFFRIFPDFPGFSRVFLDFSGFSRISSDFPGSFRIFPVFFRFSRIFRGFPRIFSIFPDFSGLGLACA